MHPLTAALGWTVIHSLWQITVLFLLWRTGIFLFRPSAAARYYLGYITLIISLLWPAYTCWHLYEAAQVLLQEQALMMDALEPQIISGFVTQGSENTLAMSALTEKWLAQMEHVLEPYIGLIAYTWIAGILWCSIRFAGGFWFVQRLRHKGLSLPEAHYRETCLRLAQKMGIRRTVLFFESSFATEPLTFGAWKPVILFPVGLLCQLSPVQVEALLLHELAHIRRHDYLLNLLQMALEVCLFYHPLFRLISRDVRHTRECCCDDAVLACDTNRVMYAKTLTDLHIKSFHLHNQFIMNAAQSNGFAKRIFYIVGNRSKATEHYNWQLLLLLLFLLSACWFQTTAFKTVPPAEQAEFWLVEPPTGGPTLAKALAAMPIIVDKGNPGEMVEYPDTSGLPVVAMGADKMNVLYIGVDNPITVAVPGYRCEDLRLRLLGDGGAIGASNNCQYNITVSKPGSLQIEVLGIQQGKEVSLGIKTFRVKRIPDPTVRFGGLNGGTITKTQLLQNGGGLQIILPNFEFEASCELVGYELNVVAKDGDVVICNARSGALPEGCIKFIESMPDSSRVFFDDIKIKCPGDTNPRNIGSISYRVVGQ